MFRFRAVCLAISVALLWASGASAQTCTVTIDFDSNLCNGAANCTEGDYIFSVEGDVSGSDPECLGFAETIDVWGYNSLFPSENSAMIFASDCPPSGTSGDCSGGDDDLGTPNEAYSGPGISDDGSGASNDTTLYNVMIISEDRNPSDPDDADRNDSYRTFDFDSITTPFVPDKIWLNSVTILDKEASEVGDGIKLYRPGDDRNGAAYAEYGLPPTGDNGKAVVPVQTGSEDPIDFAKITLRGSGAIDDLILTIFKEELGEEGCTPGFWKNHDGSLKKNGKPRPDAWVGYDPADLISSVFTIPGSYDSAIGSSTLRQGLDFKGGPDLDGAARILLRAAIASLLNAAHPDVDFSMTEAQIIAAVNAKLATMDRHEILVLASYLDAENNEGCPINGK